MISAAAHLIFALVLGLAVVSPTSEDSTSQRTGEEIKRNPPVEQKAPSSPRGEPGGASI